MDSNTNNLIYYILVEKVTEPGDAFNNFVNDLKGRLITNNIVQEGPGVVTISADSRQKGVIENNPPEVAEKFAKFQFKARLTIEKEDFVNLHKVKMLTARTRTKYRIFSVLYDCFLPANADLVNLEFGVRDEKLAKIFEQFELRPVYLSQHLGHYYAVTKTGQVVIVNKFLIDFMYGKDIPESHVPDLYYVVANNMHEFGLKYDHWLIPTDFYEYFGKNIKIINQSKFDINNPRRKVFVKPYIFELREDVGEFYQIASDDGQAMLLMDKIRPNETLDQTLKRIVVEELKIADDYLGAFVSNEVQFDRDRDGIITPRLVVWLYVEKIIRDRPKVMQMSQMGWKSVGGATPNINVKKDFEKSAS